MIELRPVRLDEVMLLKRIRNSDLSRMTGIQAGVIGWIRTGRFIPYQSQLDKIAKALDVDDPYSLLEPMKPEDYR